MKLNIILLSVIILTTQTGCSSLGLSVLNVTAKIESTHALTPNVAYGSQPWQKLDLHIPQGTALTPMSQQREKRPVIVFLYGGGWESGSRSEYYFAASAFTKRGYIVVIPDYVKYPQAKFPAFMHDTAQAIAWTKTNIEAYGGDSERLFIVGHSAGAHMGALLLADPQYLAKQTLTPSSIRAFAGMAGPYNFTPREMPYTEIFGPAENFRNMIVLNFIDGHEPPMLLLHGTDDDTVGMLNKDSLVSVIKNNNGIVDDISYHGVSHVGILLSLHSLFDGKIDPSHDIHAFFQRLSAKNVTENRPSTALAPAIREYQQTAEKVALSSLK